jgi:hypothetical protein
MTSFSRLISAISYLLIAGMILIQEDTDGALLIESWHGLLYTMVFTLVLFVWNMAAVFTSYDLTVEKEEDHFDPVMPELRQKHGVEVSVHRFARSSLLAGLPGFDKPLYDDNPHTNSESLNY